MQYFAAGKMPDWQPSDDPARLGGGGDLQPRAFLSAAGGQERFRPGQSKEANQLECWGPQVGTMLGRRVLAANLGEGEGSPLEGP